MRPTREQLVVVGDAEEEREVVGDVAALRVDEDVPEIVSFRGKKRRMRALLLPLLSLFRGEREGIRSVGVERERRRGRATPETTTPVGFCDLNDEEEENNNENAVVFRLSSHYPTPPGLAADREDGALANRRRAGTEREEEEEEERKKERKKERKSLPKFQKSHHRYPPTSKTALRSSRLEHSEKFSMRHVNLP